MFIDKFQERDMIRMQWISIAVCLPTFVLGLHVVSAAFFGIFIALTTIMSITDSPYAKKDKRDNVVKSHGHGMSFNDIYKKYWRKW